MLVKRRCILLLATKRLLHELQYTEVSHLNGPVDQVAAVDTSRGVGRISVHQLVLEHLRRLDIDVLVRLLLLQLPKLL